MAEDGAPKKGSVYCVLLFRMIINNKHQHKGINGKNKSINDTDQRSTTSSFL